MAGTGRQSFALALFQLAGRRRPPGCVDRRPAPRPLVPDRSEAPSPPDRPRDDDPARLGRRRRDRGDQRRLHAAWRPRRRSIPLLTVGALAPWIALGMVAATGLIAGFIKAVLKGERASAVQSATGFYYLAVVTAFTAEVAVKTRFLGRRVRTGHATLMVEAAVIGAGVLVLAATWWLIGTRRVAFWPATSVAFAILGVAAILLRPPGARRRLARSRSGSDPASLSTQRRAWWFPSSCPLPPSLPLRRRSTGGPRRSPVPAVWLLTLAIAVPGEELFWRGLVLPELQDATSVVLGACPGVARLRRRQRDLTEPLDRDRGGRLRCLVDVPGFPRRQWPRRWRAI